ncbi:MAG: hypothetical protein A2X12_08625 [Bacteroidetes bacterium GWE2_29_8]|nr:MAG: hypothetical protein A2X12_08625 [Bacteroidetes bacterium GWE2_29_8]
MKKVISIIVCILFMNNLGYSQMIEGIEIGNKAPELAYNNPDGKIIKLSSLKGKVVLIDFWASWCGPCRRENPTVVNVYNKYKDLNFKNGKGFAVYSVSLDRNVNAWTTGIKQDKLDWEYHVSDLLGWGSVAAAKYGVTGIPANFVIDKNGIILAKNLRGPYLEAFMQSIVEN